MFCFVFNTDEPELRHAIVRSGENTKNISLPGAFNISLTYYQENKTISCGEKTQKNKHMNPSVITTLKSGSVYQHSYSQSPIIKKCQEIVDENIKSLLVVCNLWCSSKIQLF